MENIYDKINTKCNAIKKKHIKKAYKAWHKELKEYLTNLKKKGKIKKIKIQKIDNFDLRVSFDIDI